jgi:alkylation response protein AidB-like acyl-CoA dehydrogenase
MDFHLSEEQELFRRSVAQFVDKEVVPIAAKIDEEGQFPFASCGFAMEYDVQRYFHDARLLLLGGGTLEIVRTIITKQMGL